jgi:alanyl-tRNA synthetase
MTSQQIRQAYIDFFVKKHGHTFVPSSPVVPLDDPTLLFTNAGMNQFKPIFLGQEKRAYTRAVDTQKCIRAGGKHNDLDDVGRSRRHQTFFEMLGNWSFGDYFKRGAIEMSWELLTEVFKLDPTRIHVTCYQGDEAAGIPRDVEAAQIWKEVTGLPDDHIHFFGDENFWEMGDTGPCGPCTEINYDRTPDKSGGPLVNGEDPRVMEIWNNVFIQYNRDANGKLTPLPAQHVDTGMGFERICQVIQGKNDNFGIDLWHPYFAMLTELSGMTYGGLFPATNKPDPGAEAASPQLRQDIAFRVIADHVRCLTFAINDGATPGNEGRGSVLRRILRRAAFFGRQHLKLKEIFIYKLVPVVIETMGDAFPELRRDPAHIADLIKDEEISFDRTIDRGLALFADASTSGRISGKQAFELHATYGFPIDLTEIIGAERGIAVDKAGYETEILKHREISAGGGGKQSTVQIADLPPAALAQLAEMRVGPTDDRFKYKAEPITARVMAIWDGEEFGQSPATTEVDEQLAIILDRTNYYSEMGGQVGDTGTITAPTSLDIGKLSQASPSVFDVEATKSVGGYVLHIGRLRSGAIKAGETVVATLSGARGLTEKNHTTTHLANWALREVLGDGVQQKGSLVDPEKLRFDFSHPKALADDELERVESLVNQSIGRKLSVYAEEAPQEQALKINGLRAVFGEKYPPMVRVVSIGAPVKDLLADPQNAKWREFSVEFCGGTHLRSSDIAEQFAITAEESVSKGIRRLVALTGAAASAAARSAAHVDDLIAQASAAPDDKLSNSLALLNQSLNQQLPLRAKRRAQAAIAQLQSSIKAWEKKTKSQSAGVNPSAVADALLSNAIPAGGGQLVIGEIPGASDEQLRSAMDSLRKKIPSSAILLGSAVDAKVAFVAAVSDDLIAKGLKAGDWVRETAKIAGGGGGGSPKMAQAGGKDPAKLADALAAAKAFALKSLVS